jgi:hypothetical protein
MDKGDLFVYLIGKRPQPLFTGVHPADPGISGRPVPDPVAAYDHFLEHRPDADPSLNRCFACCG